MEGGAVSRERAVTGEDVVNMYRDASISKGRKNGGGIGRGKERNVVRVGSVRGSW